MVRKDLDKQPVGKMEHTIMEMGQKGTSQCLFCFSTLVSSRHFLCAGCMPFYFGLLLGHFICSGLKSEAIISTGGKIEEGEE